MATRRHVLGLAAGALVSLPTLTGGDVVRESGVAPLLPFALRRLEYGFARGADRPLRTVVWMPDAAGRFPLVLFSHGLHGSPERYERLTAAIAAAGFVVAAPAYPHTMAGAAAFTSDDMPNQPADASAVIGALLAGPLGARIDGRHIGAAGHSAGGYTTAGLLAERSRDRRVRSAVILAGGAMNGAFSGPPADVLVAHGDRDTVVPYPVGRAAYRAVPWPKAMLTLLGADHDALVFGTGPATAATTRAVLDFLRGSLYADPSARARLRRIGGAARLTSVHLG
jgi:dienelactone hydrolase